MTDAYRPIACGMHDRLESFAVLRTPCVVSFEFAEGEVRTVTGRIEDVFVRKGAEYLRMDDGTEIRLDRLRTVDAG